MADQSTLDIYAELYKRNAVPTEHKAVVDELVRRGVIGGQKKTYGPGDKLDDGTVLDDQGLERGNILPIARDPNTNRLSLAVPGMLYQPYSAFRKSAETGTISAGDALGIAGLGITGTRFPQAAAPNSQSWAFGPGIRRAERRVENARGVADDFAAAGVQEFPAASAGEGVANTANRLMSGYFGGALRNQATRSIDDVERGVQETLATTGATRSANELGTEAQGFLKRQIVDRNPDMVPENMTAFQLQDISGVGPGLRVPQNAPPVPRVQPDQWNPQRRSITDTDIDAAMQNPPRLATPTPKLMTLEDVSLPPQIDRALQDAVSRRQSADQFLSSNGEQRAALTARMQQLSEAEKRLPDVLRPRPVGGRFASPEEAAQFAASEQAYNATLPQRQALARARAQLEQEYAPFAQAERALADADQVSQRASSYRQENLSRAQQDEASRVSREAQGNYELRMANARDEARQRAERTSDAQYLADINDPARRKAFENQASNRARAETDRRQYEADTAYRAELGQRQAQAIPERVGGNSRQPYNTEFDVGYEATRRNTPPMQMNPLGRLADPGMTETAKLLNSVAIEYRQQGLLPGYKAGSIFGDDGMVQPELLRIIDRLGGPGVAERIRALSDRRPRGAAQLGIEGLDQIRTVIGQALADARQKPIGGMMQGEGASQRARAAFLARLYDAIGNDVDQAVARVPGGELASAQRTVLRDSYRQFMQDIRAPLSKVFGEKTTPEQAVQMLKDAARGGERGNQNLLRSYFRVADEKGDRVRASGVLLNSMAEGGLEGFLSSYRGMSPEVRSMLGQGDTAAIMTRLDQLARVGGYLERFARNARPDQNVGDHARRASNAPNVVTALMAYINVPTALVLVGGQAAASRALASPAFRRWLHKVPEAKTPKEISNLLRNMSRVGAVEMGLAPGAESSNARTRKVN